MAGEKIDALDAAKASNAHLVHAVMPTIMAMVETWPIRDGVKISGIEIDGKDATITLDGKIVSGLLKKFLSEMDELCVKCLSQIPAEPDRPTAPIPDREDF